MTLVEGMWKSGQPNQINAHCVGYHHKGYPGQWFDINCSHRRMSICVSIVEGTTEVETGDYFLFMLL